MNIAIIGAGPISSYLAQTIKRKNKQIKITLFEKQSKTNRKVACTGLFTKDIQKFFENPFESYPFYKNTTKSAIIYYSDNAKESSLLIPVTEFLVDRKKFDNYLIKEAEEIGCKIYYEHTVKNIEQTSKRKFTVITSHKNKEKQFTGFTHIIIGDGANSSMRKKLEEQQIIKKNKFKEKYLIGYQYIIKTDKPIKNNKQFECYFSEKHKPFFSWAVPEDSYHIRIGTGTDTSPKKKLEKIISIYTNKNNLSYTIKEIQSGLIPQYENRHKWRDILNHKKNIYFCGDANFNLKNTTGGGIIPGFRNAIHLSGLITKNNSIPSKIKFIFQEILLHISLELHNIIYKKIESLKNKRFHKLISLTNQPKIKKILATTNRDNIIKLSMKLIIKEPKLLQFII